MTPNPFPHTSNLLSTTSSHHCHFLASPKIKINRNHQKDPQLPGTKFANPSAFAPVFPCFPPLPTGEDGLLLKASESMLSPTLCIFTHIIFNLSLHWCLLINISKQSTFKNSFHSSYLIFLLFFPPKLSKNVVHLGCLYLLSIHPLSLQSAFSIPIFHWNCYLLYQ